MLKAPSRLATLVANDNSALLTKEQKTFNSLIKKLEARRVQLLAWESAIPDYQKLFTSSLLPLIDAAIDLQVALVRQLDQADRQMALNKTERSMISEIIIDLAAALIAQNDRVELKEIYNEHSGSDYDQQEAADLMGLKSTLESALGVNLGNDEPLSQEELLQRFHAQMSEKQQEADVKHQTRQSNRKKTAREIEKETQQEAEEQQISLSIREVYRKLASALHPDREADPQERERKTALMQRVNQAYERRNLLQLLELQLELEHIDEARLKNLSAERLTHYNKILKEQLRELDQEVMHVKHDFKARFGISPYASISPKNLLRGLKGDVAQTRAALHGLERDLAAVAEVGKLKAWLKTMRHRAAGLNGFPF